MSRTVDQRVVEMQFDNRDFERNVSTSMSTLEKLKRSLNLSGAAKGLNDVGAAAKSIDMNGLGGAVDTVRARFSALQVMGVTALANITNSAVNAGKQLIKSLSVDQIAAGWSKFGSKTSSVATLVAQGNDLKTVNEQLDRLNWFTDETSYNFTDMVSNIAKFTASGKGLNESVTAMEGIANWAALSGQNATTASHAMYQLSQAIGAGVMRKEDYRSIQNVSMDTDEFRQKALDAGVALGTLKKNVDGTYESLINNQGKFSKAQFAEHLTQDAWFTSDVMMSVFQDYSAAVDQIYEYAKEKGITASEAIEELGDKVDGFGLKAFKAAQEARTWSDAVNSVKDAVSTGWMNTFEIIFGNQEEATKLWTDLANAMWDVFASGGQARNEMLSQWKELGGRDNLIKSFWNTWDAIGSVLGSVKEAFRDIFPPTTGKQLADATEKLKNFTEKLKISEETAGKLKRTFKGVFSIFDIVKKIIGSVVNAIAKLLGSDGMASLGSSFLDITALIGDFFTSLNESFDANGLSGVLSKIVSVISDSLKIITSGVGNFGDIISSVFNGIGSVAKKIFGVIKPVFEWIIDNVSAGDIFAGLAGAGIFVAAKKLSGFLDKIIGIIKGIFSKDKGGGGLKEKISGVLDSLHDSLISFSSGIKISSLVSIAIAVGILSAALGKISELDVAGITKSLVAIGAMLGMLSITLRSITKSMSTFGSKGLIKAGISMILVAAALNVLAKAMEKISKLSLRDLAKGLIGIGIGVGILCSGLKAIDKTKISVRTSIAMLALAKSCEMLGDALQKFAKMSWKEIGRGLTAMGGALAEFVISISALNKFGGGKSILGSLGILIAVQSLEKMSEGLKKFAEMSWDEIKRGLSAMGGALGELAIAIGGLGKVSGFSSIFASGAILIVVQGLDDLATALKSFGGMSWDEIKRGLVGMGGALTEVAGITGILGKLTGFSGILGSGAIVITIQGLADLVDSFKKFAGMTWDEIKLGLAGMGGALTEVAAISGVLGKLSGFSGILGAGSILIAVQSLGDLADSFKNFAGMTWDEINRGLVGMGGALTEVGTISGLLGGLTGFAGLLGSGSLLLAIQGLGDLADSFKKFGEMPWDEIKRGLSAMGGALGEVALGGLLNTLSGLGALSISKIAEPLGVLADSIKKWAGVTIPEGLGGQLAYLAYGIGQFTFDGLGASALAMAAPAVGIMANSVKKWAGVSVPEGFSDKMAALANAVGKFTFSGLGAGSLSIAAPAVGTLADSVKKWSGVTIPDGIEAGMTQIANGVKAFSFAFMGGLSLGTIIEPLANLPESIKKWNGVTLSEGLEDTLTSLANGIKAFSWAFMAGWSLETIVKPLGDLVDSVKKWAGVTVPDDLKDKLASLADGIKSFTWAFVGGWSLDAIVGPLGDLADSVKKWRGVTIPEDLGDKLSSLASGVKSFSGVTDISYAANGLKTIASSAKKLSGIDFNTIGSGLSSLSESIKNFSSIGSVSASIAAFGRTLINGVITPIKNASSQFVSLGANIVNSLVNGIRSRSSTITLHILNVMNQMVRIINGQMGLFMTSGNTIMVAFASGISLGGPRIANAFRTSINQGVAAINGCYSSFYSAGSYLVDGFANGISANAFKAELKAAAMAKAALQAAKEALGIASPSKEGYKIGDYYGLGFVNAIEDYKDKVYKASGNMAESAKTGLSEAINKIQNVLDSDMDVRPTIRPVLDLSDIESGASSINDMFGQNPSIGKFSDLSSVSAMMNRRVQNGTNADIVSAIDKLRKDFSELNRPSYNINGITYDDGSNIAEAIQTLIREAKIERRV